MKAVTREERRDSVRRHRARIARLEQRQERAWAAIEVLARSHDKVSNEHLDNRISAMVNAIGEFVRRQPHQQ
jgi:hypothetical protein